MVRPVVIPEQTNQKPPRPVLHLLEKHELYEYDEIKKETVFIFSYSYFHDLIHVFQSSGKNV